MAGVGVEILAAQGSDLDPVLEHQRRGDVVLGRQRVGRAQRRLGAASDQRQQQIRRLGGDVQARGDPDPRERPLGREPLADLREHRHLLGRPRDPGRALGREAQIGDVMRRDRGARHSAHPAAVVPGSA